MKQDMEDDLESEEESLKINIVYRWNSNEFKVVDRLSMRSTKTRLKTIVVQRRNMIKKNRTDSFIRGVYSSQIIIEP